MTQENNTHRLINQNCSSQKLGNCEVCKKPAAEVWYRMNIQTNDGTFGHKECLEVK